MTLLAFRRPSRRPALHAVTDAEAAVEVATAPTSFRAWAVQDWAANAGHQDSRVVLVIFRVGQWAQRQWGVPGRVISLACQIVNSVGIGVELPSTADIGPGLRLFHPHSIVLNPGVRIGAGCQLRHNTTIGNIVDRDGTERGNPVLGDDVDLGAGCAVLGPITIGSHARIGALAMVTKDVPEWGVVVGNPGRLLRVDAAS